MPPACSPPLPSMRETERSEAVPNLPEQMGPVPNLPEQPGPDRASAGGANWHSHLGGCCVPACINLSYNSTNRSHASKWLGGAVKELIDQIGLV